MYKNNTSTENPTILKDSITLVQSAIVNYQKTTGVLPIKNFDANTPLYEQCIVDFKKLIERGMIGEIPSSSFEKGGTNYFVILNPDTEPTVKLLDLISLQLTNELQSDITNYMEKHDGQVPIKAQYSLGWYTIDFKKLNVDHPIIKSPYSKAPIEPLVSKNGQVILDYAPDIVKAMEILNITQPDVNVDLRTFLVEASYYVPGRSSGYHWTNDQPVLDVP